MELLNENLKNRKAHGINYFLARTTEIIADYEKENKESLVKSLYELYTEEKADDEEKKAQGKYELLLGNELLEELLIVAVYVDKKLSWEDIQYTQKNGHLPIRILEKGFPFEEIKQEMLKQGYVPEKNAKNKDNEFEM